MNHKIVNAVDVLREYLEHSQSAFDWTVQYHPSSEPEYFALKWSLKKQPTVTGRFIVDVEGVIYSIGSPLGNLLKAFDEAVDQVIKTIPMTPGDYIANALVR